LKEEEEDEWFEDEWRNWQVVMIVGAIVVGGVG
jgi:hypothetical protein